MLYYKTFKAFMQKVNMLIKFISLFYNILII